MIVSIPTTTDPDWAASAVDRVVEFGGVNEDFLVIPHKTDPDSKAFALDLAARAGEAFKRVLPVGLINHPEGRVVEATFYSSVKQAYALQEPYVLLLAPGVLPTRPGWLDSIKAAADRYGKVFFYAGVEPGRVDEETTFNGPVGSFVVSTALTKHMWFRKLIMNSQLPTGAHFEMLASGGGPLDLLDPSSPYSVLALAEDEKKEEEKPKKTAPVTKKKRGGELDVSFD